MRNFETVNREDKDISTRVGDVQHHIDISTNVTVQDETPQGNIIESTPTCREQVKGTTHIGDSMAQQTPIGDVFTTHKTQKEESGHQTLIG